MIVRGTTPYHTFILPMDASDIDKIYITYLQNGEIIVEKTEEDCVPLEGDPLENASMEDLEVGDLYTFAVHLTQEETLKFKFWPAAEKNIAVIQIRVLDANGEAYASEPIRERIFGVLKDGVIPTQEETPSQSSEEEPVEDSTYGVVLP